MIPLGGISVFVHLTINAAVWVGRRAVFLQWPLRYLVIPAPVLFVSLIGIIAFFVGALLIAAVLDADNFLIVDTLFELF